MRNRGLKKRLLDRLDIIGVLAFSIAVLFIAFPNLLFSTNVEHIPKAVIYYRYFFAAAFIILLVLTFIFLFLRRGIALILALLLGAYAIMVLIFDLVYPLGIGPLMEGTESVSAAPVAGAIQIALMVGVFFALFYIPRKARVVLAWSFTAVLLISGLPFMFASPDTGHVSEQSPVSQNESAPEFNIYHIVLDGYYGPWLEWSLSELSRDTSELAGFTHYQRNVSNCMFTDASYPSFMSSTMYSPDETIMEWHEKTNNDSIIDDLHERGFSTTFYGIEMHAGMRQVEVEYTDDPGGTGVVDMRLAADYWLLRIAPVALRHVVLDDNGAGPITRYTRYAEQVITGDIRTLVSYRQFEKFLADERFRPAGGQYVHAYFYPPHGPYQLDRYGNYVGESSYEEQLLLATNMLLETVETLKEQGKFDDSLIIVQSDHGSSHGALEQYAGDPLRDFIQIDEATADAIGEVSVVDCTGTEVESRYLALLLIKLPGIGAEAGNLVVNDSLTQLLDLREYINNVLDEGDLAYPDREQVDIHHGLVFQGRGSERVTVGRDIMSGYVNHYIIRPNGNWEVCDNIPFQYK